MTNHGVFAEKTRGQGFESFGKRFWFCLVGRQGHRWNLSVDGMNAERALPVMCPCYLPLFISTNLSPHWIPIRQMIEHFSHELTNGENQNHQKTNKCKIGFAICRVPSVCSERYLKEKETAPLRSSYCAAELTIGGFDIAQQKKGSIVYFFQIRERKQTKRQAGRISSSDRTLLRFPD